MLSCADECESLTVQAPSTSSYPSPHVPIADTPLSPYEERATSSSVAGVPSDPATRPSPHSLPGETWNPEDASTWLRMISVTPAPHASDR